MGLALASALTLALGAAVGAGVMLAFAGAEALATGVAEEEAATGELWVATVMRDECVGEAFTEDAFSRFNETFLSPWVVRAGAGISVSAASGESPGAGEGDSSVNSLCFSLR